MTTRFAPDPRVPYYSHGLRARFQVDGVRAEQAKRDTSTKPADISYSINTEKYLARSAARLAAGGLPTEVPAGWPKELQGPLVWGSDSFPDENEYVYTLTNDDKKELLQALAFFKCTSLAFPFPKLYG